MVSGQWLEKESYLAPLGRKNMADKKRKKKWSETWWGLLWTLAMVEANPGRGLRVFMEVDKDFENLAKVEDQGPVRNSSQATEPKRIKQCPAGVTTCEI
jgi:ABC-type Fe3+ transport system substrate-binding protein